MVMELTTFNSLMMMCLASNSCFVGRELSCLQTNIKYHTCRL